MIRTPKYRAGGDHIIINLCIATGKPENQSKRYHELDSSRGKVCNRDGTRKTEGEGGSRVRVVRLITSCRQGTPTVQSYVYSRLVKWPAVKPYKCTRPSAVHRRAQFFHTCRRRSVVRSVLRTLERKGTCMKDVRGKVTMGGEEGGTCGQDETRQRRRIGVAWGIASQKMVGPPATK